MVDLSQVAKKVLATPDGVADYKKFLAIRATFAANNVGCEMLLCSPSTNMDAMWHAHILDTRAYKECCELLLGSNGFVHHDPYAGEDYTVQRARRRFTKFAYKDIYGEDPREGWGPDPSPDGGVERVKKRKCLPLAADAFPIYVKTLSGSTLTVQIDRNSVTEDLKKSIYEIEGVPPDQQRLVFAQRELADEEKLVDHSIQEECTVHLVLHLGGC